MDFTWPALEDLNIFFKVNIVPKTTAIEFSFVMPAFNEEEGIVFAVKKASSFLKIRYTRYEIIVVNDGSADKTLDKLLLAQKSEKSLKVVDHKKNLGYGAAVWSGLNRSRGNLVFFTDSDLQFDIEQLDDFIKVIKNHDAVIGYRKNRAEGFRRHLNASIWRFACYVLLGIRFRDIDCAFKLFRKKCIENIQIKSKGAAFSAELLFNLKKRRCRIIQKPVKHFKRTTGKATGANLLVILRGIKEIYLLWTRRRSVR